MSKAHINCSHLPSGGEVVKAKSQGADFKRRSPAQPRALETVEAIREATAQILQKEGRAALNTNRIAERAGVSIGTLYQYFPNKHAILIDLARREIERDRVTVLKVILEASKKPGLDPARIGVRALIASQKKQSKVRRAAFEALVAEGLSQFGLESASAFQQVTEFMSEHRQRLFSSTARPSPTRLFVISRAVTGVIRSAIIEESPLLGTPEFEDELVQLVRGYFRQPRGTPRPVA
jgi:AcrR family transcriptional regulator